MGMGTKLRRGGFSNSFLLLMDGYNPCCTDAAPVEADNLTIVEFFTVHLTVYYNFTFKKTFKNLELSMFKTIGSDFSAESKACHMCLIYTYI